MLEKNIRKIFSVFAVVMIGLFILRLQDGVWTNLNWVMLGLAALACVLVFWSFVYIFNFSYGLACILNGAFLAIWFANVPAFLLGGAVFIYGLRLFLFTWFRVRSDSYAERVKNIQIADAAMPTPVKFALWVQCAFLYCFHAFAIYLAGETAVLNTGLVAGVAIILAGTLIEGIADAQKQKAKAAEPLMFVSVGLFRRWRHPNYVGEILVQVGLIVAGIAVVPAGWENYAAITVAPLYVILLMISECSRADKYLELRHGDLPEFETYRAASGSFLPKI